MPDEKFSTATPVASPVGTERFGCSTEAGVSVGSMSLDDIKTYVLAAGGYVASSYQGTKSGSAEEFLATDVTGIRVNNAVGTGTIVLSVDGVEVLTFDNDTGADVESSVAVSGAVVSWVVTGITAFDLGQGKFTA